MEKLLRATHQGSLVIGEKELTCAVLEDGTRVLSRNAIFRAFGRTKRGRALEETREPNMPSFIDAKNINILIGNELRDGLKGLEYISKNGRVANGYLAELLPSICDVYLEAREKGILKPQQYPIAATSEILVRALSKVGIIALVDEATGYQEVRDRLALQAILEKYIAKELQPWVKTFPDEYYEQLFRLRGWVYDPKSFKRPILIGKITNDVIYQRLPSGVLDKLKEITPYNEKGRRKHKYFQRLSDNIGYRKLQETISNVVVLMRASPNYRRFEGMINRAMPKYGHSYEIPFDYDDDSDGE